MVKKRQMIKNGFIVSHPTGNNFVRALLEELEDQNKLIRFFTTIGVGQNARLPFKRLLERRNYKIPDSKISRIWSNELRRLLWKGKHQSKSLWTGRSYELLDQKVASELIKHPIDVVHAYEDCAANSFRRAKQLGIKCSYELPIAHWRTLRRLLSEEAERYPAWEPTLESTRESEEKLFRKDEELNLADYISCPSEFVLKSIPKNIRSKKTCIIAPFGSPPCPAHQRLRPDRVNNTLKLLFVGSMSQRKGLADLFKAMKMLKHEPVSLTVLGQPSMPLEFYRKFYSNFEYRPPCSNKNIQKIMLKHDALILPSIVEGRALVQQEALACGLPIIVTPNAGGIDLVKEGVTGYLVSIRSPQDISCKISMLIESRNDLPEIRKSCRKKAACYNWQDYSQAIINLNSTLDKTNYIK